MAPAKVIRAWEEDPLSGVPPIDRPVPKLGKGKLRLVFDVEQPPPARAEPGTPEFRYWAAADALSRAIDFWAPLLPRGTSWNRGPALNVLLDAGDNLNAFYDRDTLSFFHASVGGQTLFTAESPDVVAHECGHAVLDAIRPQLWDVMSHEAAAFHESFGDMSAILTALQLPSVRDAVVAETGGSYRTSRLSRLAEQLGWGVRQRVPCSAEPDCLRNAVNCFVYQPPDQLPIGAPASMLSSEPHSYSRVFTGGFFRMLTGITLTIDENPDGDVLQRASVDAGRLLVAAVRNAPVVPAYLSQVASYILAADQQLFEGRYADAIRNAFRRRALLSTMATAEVAAPALMAAGMREADPPVIALAGSDFGLDARTVLLAAPTAGPGMAVSAVGLDAGPAPATSAEATARGFFRELILQDRVRIPGQSVDDRLHTHEVVEEGDVVRVVRRLIDT